MNRVWKTQCISTWILVSLCYTHTNTHTHPLWLCFPQQPSITHFLSLSLTLPINITQKWLMYHNRDLRTQGLYTMSLQYEADW